MRPLTIVHLPLTILVCCLLAACQRTAPQRPTVHGRTSAVQADSATIRLLAFNQQMTDAANRELLQWVQADSTHRWAQREDGIWERHSDEFASTQDTLRNGAQLSLTLDIRRPDGSLLISSQEHITIGNSRLPLGIESVVREMAPHSSRTLLVPWYAGYGVQGNSVVGPYENILVTVTL